MVGEEAMLAGKEYRSGEDVNEWKLRGPSGRLAAALKEGGLATEAALADIDARVEKDLEDAVAYAKESEQADPAEAFTDVYG